MPSNIEIPFAAQEGNSSSPQNSRETLVNMWAEIETSGKKNIIRRQRPGTVAVSKKGYETSLVAVGMEFVERFGSRYYFMQGGRIWWHDSVSLELGVSITRLQSFTDTVPGGRSITPGMDQRMAAIFNDNGDLLFVLPDGSAAIYSSTQLAGVEAQGPLEPSQFGIGGPPAVLATPGGVLVATLAFLAGRGIFNVPDTGQFYWTDINDFATVGALSFATAESFPDPVVRVFSHNYELILWGTYSTEFWQPTSDSDAPFIPIPNATMNRGICGAYALAADDNTVHWVGDDGIVYRLDGYRPARISSNAIDRLIAGVSSAAKMACDGFVYTFEGQKFVNFRFADELSIAYNLATGLWAVTQSGTDGRSWRVMGSALRGSDFLLSPNSLLTLDGTVNTDEGTAFLRKMIPAPIYAEGKRVSIPEYHLDMEVGRQAEDGTGKVMLRVARDGESFGQERHRSIPGRGDFRGRMVWRNLGQGRNTQLEFSVSDDFNWKVTSAFGTVNPASS